MTISQEQSVDVAAIGMDVKPRPSQTIADRFSQIRAPAGFDYLRIILSVAVLCLHSVATSYGREVEFHWLWGGPFAGFARLVLPMFFALSGFLVAGSIFRAGTTSGFVLLRALRLVPALAVEVFLTAVLIGSAFTKLPLGVYLTSRGVLAYGFNIIGWIHFHLPGVFETNPFNIAVNMSLWTIPFELECYLALIVLMVTRLVKVRAAIAAITVMGCVAFFAYTAMQHGPLPVYRAVEPRLLVLAFLAGVTIYLYRAEIPLSMPLAVASAAISIALLYSQPGEYLCAPFVAYTTVWLGMQNPKKWSVLDSGDYSYGIYLYAFPAQQMVASFPALRHWYLNILIALPVSIACAVFSWHAGDKHVLKYKKALAGVDAPLPRLENWLVGRLGRGWRPASPDHVDTPPQKP